MTPAASRIQKARRRAAGARRTAVAAAAAGFLAIVLLAREAHPATSKAGSNSGSVETCDSGSTSGDDGFGLGSGSVTPFTGSQPQAQTHVS